MQRKFSNAVLPFSLSMIAIGTILGCMPASTPQEQYDTALGNLERAEARLDNLRPAYDAARKTAALMVCKEIAGITPEESALGALANLEGLTSQILTGDAATDTAPDAETAANAEGQPAAPAPTVKPIGDADAALDQLLSAHQDLQQQTANLTAPLAKANATMKQINTPGTPEAQRVEAALANMPEVKAYLRQEKRVARAQQALDTAEALLPGAAAADATK